MARRIMEHCNGTMVRVVRVPWNDRWLTRFNKRFNVDKSTYDGFFKSRVGNGYCIDGKTHMAYNFIQTHP